MVLPGDAGTARHVSSAGALPERVRIAPPLVRATPPPVRVAPPPVRVAPSENMTVVTVCGDSGDLANPYCDTYKTLRLSASQARRMHRCRLHKAPAGEGH